MRTQSRIRPLICLIVVLLVHVLIVAAFTMQRIGTTHTLPRVSTVWVIPERVPQPIAVRTKPLLAKSPAHIAKSSAFAQAASESGAQVDTIPDASASPVTPSETHLDLDAMRSQAVQQEIGRKKSPIELANEAALKNNSLEARVEAGANKAQRPDCRNAYSGAGLFAPLMVAADLIRDKGCKF